MGAIFSSLGTLLEKPPTGVEKFLKLAFAGEQALYELAYFFHLDEKTVVAVVRLNYKQPVSEEPAWRTVRNHLLGCDRKKPVAVNSDQ